MSDDENEEHEHEHGPHVFFQVGGPDPEMMERAKMEGEARSHEMRAFIDALDESQLEQFGALLQLCAIHKKAITYYLGITSALLDSKFNRCLACGKNHDKPFEEMEETSHPLDEKIDEMVGESFNIYHCCGSTVGQPHTYGCPLMVEYNVEPDDDGSMRVMCKGCERWYENLEDRMLRKPGKAGCDTCVQKEKWG